MEFEENGAVRPKDLVADFEQEAGGYYDEHDRQKHLNVSYNLKPHEVKAGLKRFQKEKRKKKRYFYISLCLLAILINLFDMIFNSNKEIYNYVFIGIALAILYVIWFMPIIHRNNIARIFANQSFNFSMKFYDDLIYIKQSDGSNRIAYTCLDNKFIEDDEKFMIIGSDQNMYIVPKRCLNERKIEKIREYAKKFEDRYIVETKS